MLVERQMGSESEECAITVTTGDLKIGHFIKSRSKHDFRAACCKKGSQWSYPESHNLYQMIPLATSGREMISIFMIVEERKMCLTEWHVLTGMSERLLMSVSRTDERINIAYVGLSRYFLWAIYEKYDT